MRLNIKSLFVISYLFCSGILLAQQLPDTAFTFEIKHPRYQTGNGPALFIDEAHNNFHTADGNFYAFAKLMRQDGFQVLKLDKPVSNVDVLNNCRILVISNALHISNVDNWAMPVQSAFTKEEIINIKEWVTNGGRLLLIADHMPFAGAAYELGKAFGFEFLNGFALSGQKTWPPSTFSVKNNTLKESPVTKGSKVYTHIDSISTFTGSAFMPPTEAIPVLCFPDDYFSLQPDTAWVFNKNTPSKNLQGFCQGAIMNFGKGKVAVFGEAAMFTAQVVNNNFKVGFNSDQAPQNASFTLNLIHWLDDIIKNDN